MKTSMLLLALAVAASPAPAAAIPQQPATAPAATARAGVRVPRDSTRRAREKLILRIDSLRWEIENRRLEPAERERIARELTSTVLALDAELDEHRAATMAYADEATRAPAAMATTVRRTGFRSRGYLGVTFDGPSVECERCEERVIRFLQYPRIALVEPASPADKAGVLEGDTLVAFNGDDVRMREVSLTKLLIPDTKLTMRVRRDGNAKDIKVTVGEAPQYLVTRVWPRTPMPGQAPAAVAMPVEPGQVRVYTVPPPAPSAAVAGRAMTVPPTPPAAARAWVFFDGIGGARMETLSEGLAKAVGVQSGVLVLRASPGTPAFKSGLRDGDVIVRVGGRNVASTREMRIALEEDESSDDGVKLVILREKKTKELTLRW
jgi:C-terminal processing protease CtpA/Prc